MGEPTYREYISRLRDKADLKESIAEQFDRMGVNYDPGATAQRSRRLMLEQGVKPEDNLFSCGIIGSRDDR
jgi:hypothetical protein